MFERVMFAQGDAATEYLEMLDAQGPTAVLDVIADSCHYPGEHDTSPTPGRGSSDEYLERDGYTLSWNWGLGYIGLEFKVGTGRRVLA